MSDAQILAAAFHDDPFFRFVDPDDHRRARWLPWFMGRMVVTAERWGVVDREQQALALWFPPGIDPYAWRTALRSGFAVRTAVMGPRASRRFAVAEKDLEQVPLETQNSWYLGYLAVHPAAQGRGRGRRLLERGLARVDAEHAGAHLETNTSDNVAIYRRFGFDVAGALDTHGVMPQWVMRREQRAWQTYTATEASSLRNGSGAA